MTEDSRQSSSRILARDSGAIEVTADRTEDGAYEIQIHAPGKPLPHAEDGPAEPVDSESAERAGEQATGFSMPLLAGVALIVSAVILVVVGLSSGSEPTSEPSAEPAEESQGTFRVYRVDQSTVSRPLQYQQMQLSGAADVRGGSGDEGDAGEPPPDESAPAAGEADRPAPEPRDWAPEQQRLHRANEAPPVQRPEDNTRQRLQATVPGQLERVPVQLQELVIDELEEFEDEDDEEFDDELDEDFDEDDEYY